MTRGVYPLVPKVRVPKVRASAVSGVVDARARRVDASSVRRARTTMATTMATVMCARARARGMPTVVVRARARTRRVMKATMKPICAFVGRGMEMNLFSKVSFPSSGFGAVYIDFLYPGMFGM